MNSKRKSEGMQAKPEGVVPKLRFPEFRDAGEWEKNKLGEIAALTTEKTGNKKYTLMSINAGVGLVSQIEKFGREIAGSSYKNYFVIRENDFAYNKSATKDYPEGFIAMHSSMELAAVPNSIFTCFRTQYDKVYPQYLKYLFLCNLHGKWLKQFISVGARAHGSLNIDNKYLLLLPIPLPKGESSLTEQQKIADCLSSLDSHITAETQNLDTLKAHKKGLMQQLFPAEGETLPKLRFPEFRDAGEWIQKSGDEITIKITKGSSPNWQGFSYQSQGILFVTSENVRDGFLDVSNPKYLSEEFYGKQQNSQLLYGDILINIVGASIGRSCLYLLEHKAFTNQAVALFRVNRNTSFKFIGYYYQSDVIQREMFGNQSESARPNLSLADLKNMEFHLPVFPEQQKIADCLSSLDDLIAAQTQKIDILKLHKKGLMQQLFPALDEVER